jgi:gliding motility-associated-like protein
MYGLNTANQARVLANPTVTTVYTVHVSQNTYCGRTATVLVQVNPKPEVFAGRDTSYNLNDDIIISALGSGTLTWIYGDGLRCSGCPETQVFPERSGCYIVEALNGFGCKATDEVCLELTEDFAVYVPNSFTPNNDGLNDEFLIFGNGITDVSIQIFNRWGELLFSTTDHTQGWDGKYKGKLCEGGTYTCIVNYTGLNRKKYVKQGHIFLAR